MNNIKSEGIGESFPYQMSGIIPKLTYESRGKVLEVETIDNDSFIILPKDRFLPSMVHNFLEDEYNPMMWQLFDFYIDVPDGYVVEFEPIKTKDYSVTKGFFFKGKHCRYYADFRLEDLSQEFNNMLYKVWRDGAPCEKNILLFKVNIYKQVKEQLEPSLWSIL